ncbi:Hypothetical protein AJAP_42720 (plasmid) [Amycolatopsis japonica]|uniref:Uncharacterized protein n=1 Tax=Amycolatopsis japonica TaxID=208439 RepID=A0A075VAE8_9PSEU|nr:hypothetical protein [Amycolatopsis japonica]AIG81311.1 Hypothetical protein AJAP_42720 [Amycolatopsis japonica]
MSAKTAVAFLHDEPFAEARDAIIPVLLGKRWKYETPPWSDSIASNDTVGIRVIIEHGHGIRVHFADEAAAAEASRLFRRFMANPNPAGWRRPGSVVDAVRDAIQYVHCQEQRKLFGLPPR